MQQPSAASDSSSRELYISARFRSLIRYCLDASLPKSAAFYAERYYALNSRCHNALHLYSSALRQCNQIRSALWLVVEPHQTNPCKGCYIARAECYTMLGLHAQAGEALEASLRAPVQSEIPSEELSHDSTVSEDEAVLHCKTGKSALKANMQEKAIQCFRHALSLNPMLWDAFEGLCATGTFPEIEELFPSRPQPVKQGPENVQPNIPSSLKNLVPSGPASGSNSGLFTPLANEHNAFPGLRPNPAPAQPFRMAMPSIGRESLASNESFYPDNSILAPLRVTRAAAAAAPVAPSRPLSSADETGPAPKKPRSQSRQGAMVEKDKKPSTGADARSKKARARPVLVSANPISSKPSLPSRIPSFIRDKQPTIGMRTARGENNSMAPPSMASRRSARLLSNSIAGDKQKTHSVKHPPQRKRAIHGRSKSTESEMDGDRAAKEATHSPSSTTQSPQSDDLTVPTWTAEMEQAAQTAYQSALADNYIYDLMRLYAACVRYLAMYDCEACLATIDLLPREHQSTVSVLILMARARYEQADYMRAERGFESARAMDPYRIWDMDLYSTTLWHLQRNAKLSFLAQELLSIDSQAPQSWIAVGNCFSLQKERSQALTCFRRAAQLDPSYAYAYALSGHELTDEDVDKAVNFFQTAIRADHRSYNAWYGLGTCYLRMSKLRLAEYHFRKAAAIHPQNAVLLGCVGMAVERRGDQSAAFALFNQAVGLSPDNALVRYRRAKILIGMKKYNEALDDLEYLRDSSPEEANIAFQLTRVYRLVGNQTKAAQMLAIARDMSPKSLNKIKRLLATEMDDAEDDSMDEG